MFGWFKKKDKEIAELKERVVALEERLTKTEEAVAKRFVSDRFAGGEEPVDARAILNEYLFGEDKRAKKEVNV